ncbi:MAG: HlyD family efflux transporter periplasmic adaptor subunit [Acidobacteria bacterium]|nr:HlyD family efflux transporter periplasmic adaptor subunit [Acidobacteriota bacterium]
MVSRATSVWLCAGALAAGLSCQRTPPVLADSPPPANAARPPAGSSRIIRATGTILAVRVYTIQVPQLQGQGGRLTLIKLARSGSKAGQDDVIAEFDRTKQLDDMLEARAKQDDFSHQVEQKRAQNDSDAEKRLTEIRQAEADLEKAQLQLRKGPILSEIDRLKNEARAEGTRARLTHMRKAHELRLTAENAVLRVVELQRDRQKVALERATTNAEKLIVRAPLAGMIALDNIWRGGSMGPAQEGDQLYTGQPLLKIFDPSEMLVQTMVNEPDSRLLGANAKATVQLDAYPDLTFEGRFESASPAASSAIGSPIKTFTVVFRLANTDARLLPDLSSAVLIRPEGGRP